MLFEKFKNISVLQALRLSVLFFAISFIFCSCEEQKKQVPKEFVRLESGKFVKGKTNESFFPLVLNYMVSIQTNGYDIWPSVFRDYHADKQYRYADKDSCLLELKAEFEHIKSLGFNTLRLVQFGEEFYNKEQNRIYLKASLFNKKDTILYLDQDLYKNYVEGTKHLFDLASNAGLKVIYLLRTKPEYKLTEKHVENYLAHFKNDTNILAWDLFNEPLYFDTIQRPKKQVIEITNNWREILNKSVPNHLYTIGLTGIREMFEWDPNILDVDFISYHPYEYEPKQVLNEMVWFNKFVEKPWIIGETSIPADGDSVSYQSQVQFAEETLKQTIACGGIGYSWWQYKDVLWNDFHSDYMGVVSLDSSYTSKGITLDIKNKPVTEVFKKFAKDGYTLNGIAITEPNNFYNYSAFNTFCLKGKIVDEQGKPLTSGVFMAWNEWWSKSYVTTCKDDGSFELYGPFEYFHWIASASKHTMTRNDINPDTAKIVNGFPTVDLGNITVEQLIK